MDRAVFRASSFQTSLVDLAPTPFPQDSIANMTAMSHSRNKRGACSTSRGWGQGLKTDRFLYLRRRPDWPIRRLIAFPRPTQHGSDRLLWTVSTMQQHDPLLTTAPEHHCSTVKDQVGCSTTVHLETPGSQLRCPNGSPIGAQLNWLRSVRSQLAFKLHS